MRAIAQIGMWGAALVFGGALAVSCDLHLATWGDGPLAQVMEWHWTLASTAVAGTMALSILFTMLGHRAEVDNFDRTAGYYRSFDESVIRWPGWLTMAIRAAAAYAAIAFVVFFLMRADASSPTARSAGAPGEADVAADAEAPALEAQRGVTALYLPVFLALGATAFFARPPD